MTSLGDGALNVPYEPSPPGHAIRVGDTQLASGVIITAGTVTAPEFGVLPVLIYRFISPDGTFYPPITLIQTNGEMLGLVKLTRDAARDAVHKTEVKRDQS